MAIFALDLTKQAPRSPRVRLGGFVILPRCLDKGRATIDTDSRVIEPGFSDLLTRDYRLSRQDSDKLAQSYPQGPVPECVLGVVRQE